MLETVILSVVVGGMILYFALIRESRMARMLNKFPGPKPYPFLGNALEVANPEEAIAVFIKWHETYGNRFRMFLGSAVGNFITTNPADLEKLFTSSALLEKSNTYRLLTPWLGDGLLISKGKKWHTRRKQLTSAFHFKILDNFLHVFNDQSQVFVDVINERYAGKETTAEIHELVTRCTLDVICETAMGTKLNCQKDLSNAFADATIKESGFVWSRLTNPLLHWDFIWSISKLGREEKANRKILHDFTNKVIKERKVQFEKEKKEKLENGSLQQENEQSENVYFSSKKKFAFLDQLLKIQSDNPAELTDEDLRAETDTFMFEGHDTTAAGISWTIFLLGLYPEHQALVQAELDSIFGEDRSRPITTTDLTQMKYLECCIKESQRIYPSVPFFSREVVQDFQLDENSVIPKGALASFVPFLIHRNPEFFPEPDEFRPSRFFPENTAGRHPYVYVPFSAGGRNCIGQRFAIMEEKTVLAHLFRSFKMESMGTRKNVITLPELIMRPQNGIHVKFTRR